MSNEESSTAIDNEKEKATNLYNALVNVSKSVFYATDKMTKTLVRKARNSLYKKDIVFVNIYNGLENKKILLIKVPLNAPFVEKKKKNIIHTMLYSFRRPFQAFCLLFVDLFTSEIYTYPMKKRNLLAKKKRNYFIKTYKKKIGQIEVTNNSRI